MNELTYYDYSKSMLTLPRHNLKLIDYAEIFKTKIETPLLNDLESYELIKEDVVNLKNKDVKRLLYHHIIHELCEYVLSVKGNDKIVIVYSTTSGHTKHLHRYIEESTLLEFSNKFINRISKMLPIKIMQIQTTFKNVNDVMELKTGECYEIINCAVMLSENFDTGSFSFNKARYFAKKYGLDFLSNNYFKKIKNKQLIFS